LEGLGGEEVGEVVEAGRGEVEVEGEVERLRADEEGGERGLVGMGKGVSKRRKMEGSQFEG